MPMIVRKVSAFYKETERSHMLQEVLDAVQNWSDEIKMQLNSKKTKDMWICFGKSIPQVPNLSMIDTFIERVDTFKLHVKEI